MQNYFCDKISKGAPSAKGNLRRATASSSDDSRKKTFKKHFFGMPTSKSDPRYNAILNLDPLARRQILPPIAPLSLTFSATGKNRNTLLDNLENWQITKRAKVICGSDDATFTYAFDDVGTWAAAAKIGNEFIAKCDGIYHFKGAQILMAKTIVTKKSEIQIESQMIEPEEVYEYKLKILKSLDLGPFLDAVSDYNTELGAVMTHNMFRKHNKAPPLAEPAKPNDDSSALNIHTNHHGGDKILTKWLGGLIKFDAFLYHFENLKAELEVRRTKDKEKEPPLGVTLALGRSGLKEALEKTLMPKNPKTDFSGTLETTGDLSACGQSQLDENPVFEPLKKIEEKIPEIPEEEIQAPGPSGITGSQLHRAIVNARKKSLTNPPAPKDASTPSKPNKIGPKKKLFPSTEPPKQKSPTLFDNEHSLVSEPGKNRSSRKRQFVARSQKEIPPVKKLNLDEKLPEDDLDSDKISFDEEESENAEEVAREAQLEVTKDPATESVKNIIAEIDNDESADSKYEDAVQVQKSDENIDETDQPAPVEPVKEPEDGKSDKPSEDAEKMETNSQGQENAENSQVEIEKFEIVSS